MKTILVATLALLMVGCGSGDNGSNGTNGSNGVDGIDGTNGIDGVDYTPEPIPVPEPEPEPPTPEPVPEPEPEPSARTIHDKYPVDYSPENMTEHLTFKYHQDGAYGASAFKADSGSAWVSAQTVNIVNGKMRVTVKAGQIKKGLSSTRNHPSYTQRYFSYEITFRGDYDFSIGGKLPGMAGKPNGSSRNPDGCKSIKANQGFSARSMFREDGRAIAYVYHQDKSKACGDEIQYMHKGQPFKFQRNKTYVIEQYIRMNTPGQHDGVLTIHVNGFPVVSRSDFSFSENGSHGINYSFFQFWHGGSASRWAPDYDSSADFDNITYSDYPLTYGR